MKLFLRYFWWDKLKIISAVFLCFTAVSLIWIASKDWLVVADTAQVHASSKLNEVSGPTTFKEKQLEPLIWGMSVEEFKGSYPQAKKVVESRPGFYQDIITLFLSHVAILGFHFGEKGLHLIVVSYIFWDEIGPLKKEEVLRKSKVIFKELKQLYGKPLYSYPWDGSYFHNIWSIKRTLIEYAWDGGNSWGVQYRSTELDADAKRILHEIPNYPRN